MKIWRKCVLDSKFKCLSWEKCGLVQDENDKIYFSKLEGKSGKRLYDRVKLQLDYRGSIIKQVRCLYFIISIVENRDDFC